MAARLAGGPEQAAGLLVAEAGQGGQKAGQGVGRGLHVDVDARPGEPGMLQVMKVMPHL